ncbi:MAG TPA: hypothetical protein PK054_12635 [Anaerohalosphaeraceae bacterium]|nr:hypothetical protein [Anaerohalosphaeraceae bacterium]HOL90007.1 hypothetical protein [Anaerohalosphaeraceae bacterium]HPP57412.1 hypothetical protein [Anaerohalosphaeraceae bacterium]
MAESSLSITFDELRIEVADYLGLGRDKTKWGPDNSARIDSYIKSGLRQFYYPPAISANSSPHTWSFLSPTASLQLVIGQAQIDLPDDFGHLVGSKLYYNENYLGSSILVIGEGQLRQLLQTGIYDGRPTRAAIRPKKMEYGNIGQRWELVFDRNPDDAYVLYYRYSILPSMLEDLNRVYPYGGMAHSSTILASCLAEADLRMNGNKGALWNTFLERLTASIEFDYKLGRVHYFGYNGPGYGPFLPENDRVNYVSLNGVLPWE